MNADVAYSFILGMFPKDIQEEILKTKVNMLMDPALSFSVFQENCTKVIIDRNKSGHSVKELAALFYLWGVNAAAASEQPVVVEASRLCNKIREEHSSIADKISAVMRDEFDRILNTKDAHKEPKIVEQKENVFTANFGKKEGS